VQGNKNCGVLGLPLCTKCAAMCHRAGRRKKEKNDAVIENVSLRKPRLQSGVFYLSRKKRTCEQLQDECVAGEAARQRAAERAASSASWSKRHPVQAQVTPSASWSETIPNPDSRARIEPGASTAGLSSWLLVVRERRAAHPDLAAVGPS